LNPNRERDQPLLLSCQRKGQD